LRVHADGATIPLVLALAGIPIVGGIGYPLGSRYSPAPGAITPLESSIGFYLASALVLFSTASGYAALLFLIYWPYSVLPNDTSAPELLATMLAFACTLPSLEAGALFQPNSGENSGDSKRAPEARAFVPVLLWATCLPVLALSGLHPLVVLAVFAFAGGVIGRWFPLGQGSANSSS
jgi:hypothetical protein